MVLIDGAPGIESDEEVLIRGIVVQELPEILAPRGAMVDDSVEHQLEAEAHLLDVVPGAESRIDFFEIHYRETPVG